MLQSSLLLVSVCGWVMAQGALDSSSPGCESALDSSSSSSCKTTANAAVGSAQLQFSRKLHATSDNVAFTSAGRSECVLDHLDGETFWVRGHSAAQNKYYCYKVLVGRYIWQDELKGATTNMECKDNFQERYFLGDYTETVDGKHHFEAPQNEGGRKTTLVIMSDTEYEDISAEVREPKIKEYEVDIAGPPDCDGWVGVFPEIETCTDESCEVWGDPHINVFDNAQVSLLSVLSSFYEPNDINKDRNTDLKIGDFWLVKSNDVYIQGRYNLVKMKTGDPKPFLRALAVGGPFLKGNHLVIGAKRDGVYWNGQKVMTSLEDNKLVVDDLINATYHYDLPLVQDSSKKSEGLHIKLALGVKMLVNRQKDRLSVKITSGQLPGGQDGECGNFNRDPTDDTEEQIQQRGSVVAVNEELFSKLFNPWRQDHQVD